MEQAATELLGYGVTGAVAVLFLWLYLNERKEHKHTQDKLIDSYTKRAEEARETVNSIQQPLEAMSTGIRAISDKIDISRRGR